MDHDLRESGAPVALPETEAAHLDSKCNFDETILWCRQLESSRQKKADERLHMSAPKPRMRTENGDLKLSKGYWILKLILPKARRESGIGLRSCHELILMERAAKGPESFYAHLRIHL